MSGIKTNVKDLGNAFEKFKGLQTENVTPTWSSVAPLLSKVLETGTDAGKKFARAEIIRMAEIADKYVTYQKSIQP